LNGRVQGTVAEATQRRVREAAAELGYTRSAVAVSLRERRTGTIGLITDEIATSPFAGRMARAASLAAPRVDYLVITMELSMRDHSVSEAARLLAERQVDGLVYATMGRLRVPGPRSRRASRWCCSTASSTRTPVRRRPPSSRTTPEVLAVRRDGWPRPAIDGSRCSPAATARWPTRNGSRESATSSLPGV